MKETFLLVNTQPRKDPISSALGASPKETAYFCIACGKEVSIPHNNPFLRPPVCPYCFAHVRGIGSEQEMVDCFRQRATQGITRAERDIFHHHQQQAAWSLPTLAQAGYRPSPETRGEIVMLKKKPKPKKPRRFNWSTGETPRWFELAVAAIVLLLILGLTL